MNKHIRPRCFLDISINGAPQGRITVELYDDVVPQTCSNFLQLCEGLTRLGRETGKPLSYRGSLFHRVIDGFMIQVSCHFYCIDKHISFLRVVIFPTTMVRVVNQSLVVSLMTKILILSMISR